MTVRLLFFSVLRDIVGTDEVAGFACPNDCGVQTLLDLLFNQWPGLAEWDASLLVAVDQTYVKRDAALHPGCEVALMPPVQGG